MSIWTDRDMTDLPVEQQAKRALSYALCRIKDDPSIGYFCGLGTQMFALLTEAAATIHGDTVENVRRRFAPTAAKNPKEPDWISVDKQLPDANLCVIVHVPDAASEPVWIGHHDGDRWQDTYGGPVPGTVTHWAPFPEPPDAE